ncbi:heme-binding protein [Rhodobacterales bacterium]|nr:heme-binding protein [Rhodobacterales bacterium]
MRSLVAGFVALVAASPALAQSSGTHTVEVMDIQLAMKAALRAILVCNEAGYQVGVSVVDRFGIEQATLRSNMGGAYVTDRARQKAWTAAIYNAPAGALKPEKASASETAALAAAASPGAVPVPGGIPILSSSGQMLGGIGVAGGGGSETEAECARAGLDAIRDHLE